jgi:hypothetical protein
MTEIDYSVRYGKSYLKRVAIAQRHHKRLAGGICCCCLVREGEEMHHTSYGRDRLGRSWFSVCKKCHTTICHNKKHWIREKGQKAVWGNRNTDDFANKLRANYKLLVMRHLSK